MSYGVARGRETPGLNSQSFRLTEQGLSRVQYAVRELFDIDKNRAIKAGLRAMGRVFVKGGRGRLKTRMKSSKGVTGNLYRAFTIRVKKMKLGAMVGFKGGVGGGGHSHLVDRGTVRRFTKSGADRGIMPANKFWTETADQDWKKATDVLFDAIERAVQRIIERNAY